MAYGEFDSNSNRAPIACVIGLEKLLRRAEESGGVA